MGIALSLRRSCCLLPLIPTAAPRHSRCRLGRRAWPVLVAWLLGCSTSNHGGRGRYADEPARLITTSAQAERGYSTEILKIDGRIRAGSSRTLAPGRHRVEVIGENSGHHRGDFPFAGGAIGAAIALGQEEWDASESPLLTACFLARPGHTYEARTFVEGGVWQAEVFDQQTTYVVQSPCPPAPYEQPRK